MHKCKGASCEHKDHRVYVPGEPCEGAEIMFIGMAPGQKEVDEGRPFVGPAGYRFNTELSQAGLSRKKSWVTNSVKYFPPKHKISNLPDEFVVEGLSELEEEIAAFKEGGGKIIVPLGNDAIKALTSKMRVRNPLTGSSLEAKVTKWRGSILEAQNGLKVIPTLHPSAINRVWDYLTLFKMDLRRIKEEVKAGKAYRSRAIYTPADGGFDEALEELRRRVNDPEEVVAADIEVVDGRLYCCAFSWNPEVAVVLDGQAYRDLIASFLEAPSANVWHNCMYDLVKLEGHCNIVANGKQHDTQLMWYACSPELACSRFVGKSLGRLASLFTREPYYKDERKQWKEVGEPIRFMRYCGRDAAVTRELYDILDFKLDNEKVRHVYEFDQAKIPLFKSATIRGVPINTKKKGIKKRKAGKRLEEIEDELEEILGYPINYNSWQQKLKALRHLDIPARATNISELQRLASKERTDRQARYLELLLERSAVQKEYGTYLSFDYDGDGRIRPSWNISGTETGRASTSQSIIYAPGIAIQTVPASIRDLFEAPDGWTVLNADLSKAELRIVANLCGSEDLLNILEADDMWEIMRARVGQKFSKVAVKNCVYGTLYKGGPQEIAREMNARARKKETSTAEIRKVQNQLFKEFPELKAWHSKVKKDVSRTLSIETLGVGRRRRFRPRGRGVDKKSWKEALNFVPQGTVPEIIYYAAMLAHEDLPEDVWWFWAHMHDGIVGAIRNDKLEDTIKYFYEALHVPISCEDIQGRMRTFFIPVDIEIGPSWGELESYP